MKMFRAFPAAFLVLIGSSVSADQRDEDIRKEILELEQQWETAVLKGEVAFFERVLAPEFAHTNYSGEVRDRKHWLANHKPGRSPYRALNTQDLQVKSYGDTALVAGRIRPQGTSSAGQEIQGEYRFLRVWAKRDGHWQVVAFQSTRIAERAEPKE